MATKEEAKPAAEGAKGDAHAASPAASAGGGGIKGFLPLIIMVVLMPALSVVTTKFLVIPKVMHAREGGDTEGEATEEKGGKEAKEGGKSEHGEKEGGKSEKGGKEAAKSEHGGKEAAKSEHGSKEGGKESKGGKKRFDDNAEIKNKTGAGKPEGPDPMSIMLQSHGYPVFFQNWWIVEK